MSHALNVAWRFSFFGVPAGFAHPLLLGLLLVGLAVGFFGVWAALARRRRLSQVVSSRFTDRLAPGVSIVRPAISSGLYALGLMLFAVALAEAPVGVDIEPSRAIEPPWSLLHPNERKALETLTSEARPDAFLRLWTAKEAYLKALGLGFARDPTKIAISLDFSILDEETAPTILARGWRRLAMPNSIVISPRPTGYATHPRRSPPKRRCARMRRSTTCIGRRPVARKFHN